MDKNMAESLTGGLSYTSKMPGASYSLPAILCKKGSELRKDPESPCYNCYAMKGFYSMPNVRDVLLHRFSSIHHPKWVDAMVILISNLKEPFFRWHDSGDIQNIEHLNKIYEICRRTTHIKHWLPTQELNMLSAAGDPPANLIIRVSNAKRADFTSAAHRDTTKYPTSSVITRPKSEWIRLFKKTNSRTQYHCPSSFQDGKCDNCRACWNGSITHILYRRH